MHSPPSLKRRSSLQRVEDIDKLNIDILKKVENKILIPKNLLISFYYEGDPKTAKKISGKLSKLFSDFPKESAKKNKIKEKLLEKINPNFIPGETFRQDHGLNNELITTQFVWSFNDKFPSTKYFALEILEKIIDTHLHIYSREHGWGYHTDVNIIHATDNLRFLTMQIDYRKDSQKDFLRSINKILSLSETKIQNAVKNERKRQAATPINIVSRLSWIVYGLKYHDAMINADKIREIMLGVTEKDLKELSDQLQSIKPVTITTGDID